MLEGWIAGFRTHINDLNILQQLKPDDVNRANLKALIDYLYDNPVIGKKLWQELRNYIEPQNISDSLMLCKPETFQHFKERWSNTISATG